jgi:hypothetical protein
MARKCAPARLFIACTALALLACGDGATSAGSTADTAAADNADTPNDTSAADTSNDTSATDTSNDTSATDTSNDTSQAASVIHLDIDCERVGSAATRCDAYEVTCGGATPARVDVAVFEPPTPSKGVVIFGSGGGGTGFYNYPGRRELLDAGYTILERRWLAAEGWFSGATEGPAQASCRFAALLAHLKTTLAPDIPLCATGNSGGSAELVYALTWHDAASSLAFAMPTSGPFHRLDLICQGALDPSWVTEADALRESLCPDCEGDGYQAGPGILRLIDASFGGPRCSAPTPSDLATLRAASPDIGPFADDLAALPVAFKVGKLDQNAFAAFVGALNRELAALGADVDLAFLSGVGHEMDKYELGVTALRDALLAHCR